MKKNLNGLSQRYAAALRKHLQDGTRASLQVALGLGREAVALGLETLELARMHEQAVSTLATPKGLRKLIQRAQIFFTEAITPIVETHRVARQQRVTLNRLNEMLGRCTIELAGTNRQLKRGIGRRKAVEATLKKTGDHYTKLLKDSLQIQSGFRQLTHQVLAAQEEDRKNISRELQDEVAQTLLGINIRLLALKQESKSNSTGFKNEIASTQRMVAKSAKSVRVVANRLGNT